MTEPTIATRPEPDAAPHAANDQSPAPPTPSATPPASLTLTVNAASPVDADRGVARLDPQDLAKLGAAAGDILAITGKRTAYARALPAHMRHRGLGLVQLDGAQRENAGIGVGDGVVLARATPAPAERLKLKVAGVRRGNAQALADLMRPRLLDQPFGVGDVARARLLGGRAVTVQIANTTPDGPVIVTERTALDIVYEADAAEAVKDHAVPGARAGAATEETGGYAELGGLAEEIARVREMVELPLRRPELFARLGVSAPRGVLFTGPPGTGKTLLARAVAKETRSAFFQISAPEIVSKHYGDSEARLRQVFQTAEAKAPSIVFIDEIDAIAPKRDSIAGDKQLERRVVAQLLTLLDGLSDRGQVVVMAATNLPDSLDPALRRPGRFDREIRFRVPDRAGRAEILAVHTRPMPLAEGVDLDRIAAATHGYVGADLAALAREAAMACLRRVAEEEALRAERMPLEDIEVVFDDFQAALAMVGPSAIREIVVETPEVTFADVGGLSEVKAALTEAVLWPMRHALAHQSLGLDPVKGVILAGPPGCGKTYIARALAAESGVNFIVVRGPQLLSQYVGESERAVREVFAKARLAAPCLLFFDEIDALAPRRGSGGGAVVERVVAQMLTEIDGVEELRGVFLLGATNRVELVDDALIRPGRFDQIIEIGPPDAAARAEILRIRTRKMALGGDVDLTALAAEADGMVGADLDIWAQTAARTALRRALEGRPEPGRIMVEAQDFRSALVERRRSDAARRQSRPSPRA